jgi:hypothetical protein
MAVDSRPSGLHGSCTFTYAQKKVLQTEDDLDLWSRRQETIG